MSIKGLTERGCAFPQIGNIRKGDKGGNNGAPRDLNYFKVDFDEREKDAITAFAAAYGGQPQEINILLPFNEVDRCWDAWCEAYTAGRMVARSDGEKFLYRVDLASGKVVVMDGVNVQTGEIEPHREVIGKTEKSIIKCRPVGRLRVIVPELRRLAYLVVHTTSVIDIRNISEQLAAIQQINGGRIVGIPLVLKRRPKQVSCPSADGSRARRTKWMLSIEADPAWVAAKITQLGRSALPEGTAPLALPAVVEEEAEDAEWDDEIDDAEELPISHSSETVINQNVTQPAPVKMSLEMAESELNAEGIRYGDLDNDKLEKMLIGIGKGLAKKDSTPEKLEELTRKRDAINTLLAARAPVA